MFKIAEVCCLPQQLAVLSIIINNTPNLGMVSTDLRWIFDWQFSFLEKSVVVLLLDLLILKINCYFYDW